MARTPLYVRKQSGGMFAIVNETVSTGNNIFVNSVTGTNAAGYGENPDAPVASIDYAVGLCTANSGDRIFAMPLHVETVGGAAALAVDVAGIDIIGLGRGSARPKVNFTATGSTAAFSAANCSVKNILFTGGVDAVVSPIVVSAADIAFEDFETRDVTGQATDWILTTAGADRLLLKNWRHDAAIVPGPASGLAIVGGDGIVVDGFRMDGDFSVAGIDIRTTATTDLEVRNGYFRTRNAADLFIKDTVTGSTGIIGPNINIRLQDDAANITEACTGATFVYFNPIRIVNAAGQSSMESNITASTDAIV